MRTVLLLAGTAEARAFAGAFRHRDVRLIASLAGVTANPRMYPCETRIGGFGGVGGLRAYLGRKGVVAVIDATHPFAIGMSRNAAMATADTATPALALVRPPWPALPNWRHFTTLDGAVAAIPAGARVLATTGRKDVAPFLRRDDMTVFLRSVDIPTGLPAHIVPVGARGPFTVGDEDAYMRHQRITHLVTRNAGGDSRARLDAAAMLALPVHIIDRPPHPAANAVNSVADALQWVHGVLGD